MNVIARNSCFRVHGHCQQNAKRIHCHAPSRDVITAAEGLTSTSHSNGSSTSSSRDGSSRSRTQEMCVIVDEQNRVVGAALRRETVSCRLLGRGSYVLVFNSAGELFVSQRSERKDVYPGCLDVSISGVVNQGEEYEQTAARELQEEIGVPLQHSASGRLQHLFVFPYKDEVCHVWGCAFKVVWDGAVCFQDKEVEWGRFMPLQDLQQLLQQQPQRFTPVGRHILQLYLKQEHHAGPAASIPAVAGPSV